MKIAKVDNRQGCFQFHCPGCQCTHTFFDKTNTEGMPAWDFNNDLDNPTISPSIRVVGGNKKGTTQCHSFIESGKIRFLSDCTHELAGYTVELPLILF